MARHWFHRRHQTRSSAFRNLQFELCEERAMLATYGNPLPAVADTDASFVSALVAMPLQTQIVSAQQATTGLTPSTYPDLLGIGGTADLQLNSFRSFTAGNMSAFGSPPTIMSASADSSYDLIDFTYDSITSGAFSNGAGIDDNLQVYDAKNTGGGILNGAFTPILGGPPATNLTTEIGEFQLSPTATPAGGLSIGLVFPTGMDQTAQEAFVTGGSTAPSFGGGSFDWELIAFNAPAPIGDYQLDDYQLDDYQLDDGQFDLGLNMEAVETTSFRDNVFAQPLNSGTDIDHDPDSILSIATLPMFDFTKERESSEPIPLATDAEGGLINLAVLRTVAVPGASSESDETMIQLASATAPMDAHHSQVTENEVVLASAPSSFTSSVIWESEIAPVQSTSYEFDISQPPAVSRAYLPVVPTQNKAVQSSPTTPTVETRPDGKVTAAAVIPTALLNEASALKEESQPDESDQSSFRRFGLTSLMAIVPASILFKNRLKTREPRKQGRRRLRWMR